MSLKYSCYWTLFLYALLFLSCSSSRKIPDYTPSASFDADQYINPQNFGYKLSIKKIEQNNSADSAFVPVFVNGGMRKAFGMVNYPQKALQKGIKGKVILELYINKENELTNIEIIKTPHKLLTEAAVDAAKQWNYISAKLNGKPVNSFIRVPINFRMQSQKIGVEN